MRRRWLTRPRPAGTPPALDRRREIRRAVGIGNALARSDFESAHASYTAAHELAPSPLRQPAARGCLATHAVRHPAEEWRFAAFLALPLLVCAMRPASSLGPVEMC